MASSIGKPEHLKRLGELLQEQQEPFLLQVFLLERGYSKRAMNLKGKRRENSCKNSKGSASSGWLKRKKRIPPCSKVLKSIVNKLVSVEEHQKMSSNYNVAFEDRRFGVCQTSGRTHTSAEMDLFSSASSMTVLDSSSESTSHQNLLTCSSVIARQALKLRNFREQQTTTNGVHLWRYIEDSKNHSPVSVLELPLDQVVFCTRAEKKEIPSTSNFKLPKEVTEDSIFSAALRELLRHSLTERREPVGVAKPQEVVNASPQQLKTKRTLEQTKQLLFDCVREAVENNDMNRKERTQQKKHHELLEAEKVGKFICDSICLWGKQSGNLTNITQLINSDFWNARDEWRDVRPQMKEIGLRLEEAIWEEMRNEIVIDMMTVYQ